MCTKVYLFRQTANYYIIIIIMCYFSNPSLGIFIRRFLFVRMFCIFTTICQLRPNGIRLNIQTCTYRNVLAPELLDRCKSDARYPINNFIGKNARDP